VKKWDWKTWTILAFGGAAFIAGTAFLMQSKHAALGRQVHRNVTNFLLNHGSKVHSGIISGGLVSTPMKTNIAVNSTVVSMLNNYDEVLGQTSLPSGGAPGMQEEQGITTGIGGVQGRAGPKGLQQQEPSPTPVSPTARAAKAPAAMVRNPSEISTDDSGYANQSGRDSSSPSEYDPDEFKRGGKRPPENVDLFADDGIPSSGPASMPPRQEGFE